MNRTIKDATVKRYFYQTHDEKRLRLPCFGWRRSFARRFLTLSLWASLTMSSSGTTGPRSRNDLRIQSRSRKMPGLAPWREERDAGHLDSSWSPVLLAAEPSAKYPTEKAVAASPSVFWDDLKQVLGLLIEARIAEITVQVERDIAAECGTIRICPGGMSRRASAADRASLLLASPSAPEPRIPETLYRDRTV